ncbi:hypothetical protein ACSBR1_005000 [Camellia fascicularis]
MVYPIWLWSDYESFCLVACYEWHVLDGTDAFSALHIDQVENLIKFCPTKEEMTMLKVNDLRYNLNTINAAAREVKESAKLRQECESKGANKMIDYLRDLVSKSKPGDKYDDFAYNDPTQILYIHTGRRKYGIKARNNEVLNLQGTGLAGAIVRMYIEQFEPDVSKHDMDAQTALKPLIDLALFVSKLKDFTGREKPTVIT